MNIFSQFGIAKRLYLVSFVLIAALGGLAVMAWMQLSDVNTLAHRVSDMREPQMQRIAAIELNVTRTSLQ